jgi:hypothetical protein
MPLKVGMSAIQVVCEIAKRNAQISKMRFGIYRLGEFSRLPDPIEEKAKQLRNSSRLHGYWQSIISVCWQDTAVKQDLLRAIGTASKHEESLGASRIFDLKRRQITESELHDCIKNLKPKESLFVSSQIKLVNRRWVHIPMMDFTCYDTDEDLEKVVFAISTIGLKPGVLLRSGKSFHFYGYSPLSPNQWLQFLGKCLLLVPISDARYIGHRMIDGACTLRLSSGFERGNEPYVAKIIN